MEYPIEAQESKRRRLKLEIAFWDLPELEEMTWPEMITAMLEIVLNIQYRKIKHSNRIKTGIRRAREAAIVKDGA